MMEASFEANGAATPEFRAAILGEMLRLVAVQIGAVPYGVILDHIMKASSCTEDQVGGEVLHAWFILDRSNLVRASEFGVVRSDTTMTPTPIVTDYIWEDQAWFSDEEEGA